MTRPPTCRIGLQIAGAGDQASPWARFDKMLQLASHKTTTGKLAHKMKNQQTCRSKRILATNSRLP